VFEREQQKIFRRRLAKSYVKDLRGSGNTPEKGEKSRDISTC